MKIKNIQAREILDSNGKPTISTEIELLGGDKGVGDVPSGASTGSTEVLELRDKDGLGVTDAVNIINTKIKDSIIEKEFKSQEEFDNYLIELDGTQQKSKLGGNSILSCSMAFCRASTNSLGLELYEYISMIYSKEDYNPKNFTMPSPLVLVMEGGKHGDWATDIQEFMIVPNVERFKTFEDGFRQSIKVFQGIRDILKQKRYSTNVGFEGAFAPVEIKDNKEALDIILQGIQESGYTPTEDFSIAIDVAASEIYDKTKQKYILKKEKKEYDTQRWISFQKELYSNYPLISIEDPLIENDWSGWNTITKALGEKYQIVGDDLLTTNTERIQQGIENKAMNSVLIKLNQIGTVTETLNAIKLSVDNGMTAIISHRSGETNDSFIADLVVGTPATQCKFGGPTRGERLVKYNRLLEIEKKLTLESHSFEHI
ncbi:MAG TPA: phosphopyruvate hydratase [Candidatus Dojkabacteria bacterium]|nr:phosphopyruvate hydratase [Candidatus Dojkabacteria bacterium]